MIALTDTVKLTALKESLAKKFELLQTVQQIPVIDVVDALAKHVNAWYQSLTGDESRPVGEYGGTAGTKFVIENGKPYASVVVDYVYSVRTGKPIDIDFLSDIMPGVNMKQDHAITSGVFGEMVFDLSKWPSLIPDLLYSKVYKAYMDNNADKSDIDDARAQVLAMTSFFYPKLTDKDWQLAADMGMLDNWAGYYTVINQQSIEGLDKHNLPGEGLDIL